MKLITIFLLIFLTGCAIGGVFQVATINQDSPALLLGSEEMALDVIFSCDTTETTTSSEAPECFDVIVDFRNTETTVKHKEKFSVVNFIEFTFEVPSTTFTGSLSEWDLAPRFEIINEPISFSVVREDDMISSRKAGMKSMWIQRSWGSSEKLRNPKGKKHAITNLCELEHKIERKK